MKTLKLIALMLLMLCAPTLVSTAVLFVINLVV